MTDLAPIHELLAAKEAEIQQLDHQRDLLNLQAEALRDALRAMGDTSIPPARVERKTPSAGSGRKAGDSRFGTRLSPKWREALGKLAENGGEFGYDDVLNVAGGVSKDLARTKMSEFLKGGLVQRRRPGFFVLTDQGRRLGTAEQPKTEPVTGGPPNAEVQKVEAPGVGAPGASIAAPVVAQVATPVSGMSTPSPSTGA